MYCACGGGWLAREAPEFKVFVILGKAEADAELVCLVLLVPAEDVVLAEEREVFANEGEGVSAEATSCCVLGDCKEGCPLLLAEGLGLRVLTDAASGV